MPVVDDLNVIKPIVTAKMCARCLVDGVAEDDFERLQTGIEALAQGNVPNIMAEQVEVAVALGSLAIGLEALRGEDLVQLLGEICLHSRNLAPILSVQSPGNSSPGLRASDEPGVFIYSPDLLPSFSGPSSAALLQHGIEHLDNKALLGPG